MEIDPTLLVTKTQVKVDAHGKREEEDTGIHTTSIGMSRIAASSTPKITMMDLRQRSPCLAREPLNSQNRNCAD